MVRAPVCETRKGEGLEPVQIPGRVALETSDPVLEEHSRTDREVREASVAGRMDSMVADMALAWEALAVEVAPASACVHEHREHPEQN